MNTLEKRALEFEADVENYLVDSHGLVRSALDINTMRPFEKSFFEGASVLGYPGRTWEHFGEFMTYENVGMCSGAYLAAQLCKYRTTKNPEALEKARRTFRGIQWLFNLSQAVEPGFYCKCYGGRISEQISSDQYVYTLAGLDRWLHFADAETRNETVDMITAMARFWIRRNYTYPYYGKPLEWPIERFPVFPWLAWHHSGQTEFRQEFERLCARDDVRNTVPFGRLSWDEVLEHVRTRDPVFAFERNTPFRLIKLNPESTASGFLSLEAMLEYNAPHRDLWLHKARTVFDTCRHWFADDGYAMGSGLYDLRSGQVTEVREVLNLPEPDPNRWRFFGLIAWIRSGMRAAMFARAAVALDAYLPESGARAQALDLLEKLDRDKLRWFVDMDGHQFPPDLQWMHHVYSGDAVTNWLWAYWQTRADGHVPSQTPTI